jgi:hypothetical protein
LGLVTVPGTFWVLGKAVAEEDGRKDEERRELEDGENVKKERGSNSEVGHTVDCLYALCNDPAKRCERKSHVT